MKSFLIISSLSLLCLSFLCSFSIYCNDFLFSYVNLISSSSLYFSLLLLKIWFIPKIGSLSYPVYKLESSYFSASCFLKFWICTFSWKFSLFFYSKVLFSSSMARSWKSSLVYTFSSISRRISLWTSWIMSLSRFSVIWSEYSEADYIWSMIFAFSRIESRSIA